VTNAIQQGGDALADGWECSNQHCRGEQDPPRRPHAPAVADGEPQRAAAAGEQDDDGNPAGGEAHRRRSVPAAWRRLLLQRDVANDLMAAVIVVVVARVVERRHDANPAKTLAAHRSDVRRARRHRRVHVQLRRRPLYFSKDPAACANCHIMNSEYDSWQKASHHTVAKCVDCHLPHDFVPKYLAKAENGMRHSYGFTFQNFTSRFTSSRWAVASCRRTA
jgi:hypothetical protein